MGGIGESSLGRRVVEAEARHDEKLGEGESAIAVGIKDYGEILSGCLPKWMVLGYGARI